jgi:hypothetical protein
LPSRGVLILAATLLTAYAFIEGLSIGTFYLPAAATLWLGVSKFQRPPI